MLLKTLDRASPLTRRDCRLEMLLEVAVAPQSRPQPRHPQPLVQVVVAGAEQGVARKGQHDWT
jgi:hypothetical protein